MSDPIRLAFRAKLISAGDSDGPIQMSGIELQVTRTAGSHRFFIPLESPFDARDAAALLYEPLDVTLILEKVEPDPESPRDE